MHYENDPNRTSKSCLASKMDCRAQCAAHQGKEATRARDTLNAERRRLPMVRIEKDYVFEGPSGKANLLDLFDGRRQLIIYHFMFDPEWDEGCPGCSFFVDNICHLAHLHARDTSLVLVSRAPLAKIKPFKKRMGWTVPWFSSFRSKFNYDFGVTTDEGETFGLSVFLRDGDRVFHTYFTDGRGVEALARIFHQPLGKSGTELAKKRGPSELHSASWRLATNSLSWRLVQAWGDWFTRLRARGADTLLRTKWSSPRSSSSQVTSSPALSPIAAARGSGK